MCTQFTFKDSRLRAFEYDKIFANLIWNERVKENSWKSEMADTERRERKKRIESRDSVQSEQQQRPEKNQRGIEVNWQEMELVEDLDQK